MTHWNQNSKSTSCNLTRTRNHFGLFHLRNKACLFEQHNCATFAVFAYDCICRAAKSETSIITLWDYGIVSKAGYTSNLCNFHAEQHVRWHMGHGALGDPIRTHLNKGLRQDSSAEGARPWTRPCRQVETRPERQKLQPRSPHWQRRLDRTNHDNKQLSYGSKIGYQSTNKMCIFAVNRPFLGLVIWARPKESTGRTQRTLDCFHAELVIKSLERLVDFRFFQTSKHRKHRLRLSQGCEKKNWCEKTPSSRYTAPRGKWRLQAPEKVSLQNHAALPCSAMLFQSESEEPPTLGSFGVSLTTFWPKCVHAQKRTWFSQGSPLYLRLRPQHRKLSKWCGQRIGEMVDTVNTTHFWQVIWGWYMKYVIQLRNVVRTTINHPPSPIWPELCLAIPSP